MKTYTLNKYLVDPEVGYEYFKDTLEDVNALSSRCKKRILAWEISLST